MHQKEYKTKQKRISSLSFSQQNNDKDQSTILQKNHTRQYRSHEQKKILNQQKSMKQKASLNKLLTNLIQQHNKINQQNNKNYQWEILLIDQKRTITGIKVKLKCVNMKYAIFIVVRISFNLEYFRQGKVGEGNVFVELDQLNFQLSKNQVRSFQAELQKMLKPSLTKTIYTEQQQDSFWIKQLFNGVEKILNGNNYDKRSKKATQNLNRKQILTNYMLYHSPVSFAWSPKGIFCVTENKIPQHKNSFIGNPLSFKLHIQVPKVSHLNTVNQQQLASSQQQSNQNLFFNWDIDQQVQMLSFNRYKKQLSQFYKDNTSKTLQTKKKITSSNLKTDTVILQYASKLTPTMRKIYQRYFIIKPDHSQSHRGQKINVFSVMSQIKRCQDDMLYLMQKINLQKYRDVTEVVMSHLISGYNSILTINNSIDKLKYFILGEFIKQQKLKSSNLNLSLLLKSMIVQNEYHSQQLQSYFKRCYEMMNIKPSSKIYYLGSYIHFDQKKSQTVLMQLIEKYIMIVVNDKKMKFNKSFQLSSSLSSKIKKYITVKKVIRFPPISQEWLISQDQRKKLIEMILPVLLVRDRNYQDYYYFQIEKMIVTNTKIINFYKILLNVIKKIQDQKYQFLQQMIYQYQVYQQQKKIADPQLNVRRQFIIYCQKCQRQSKTFEISEAEKLKICNKCKK